MKQKYLESTIDELGRIAIPKEIREELGLKELDSLAVSIIDNELALCPVASEICVICGNHKTEQLHDFTGKRLCNGCIVAIDNNELSPMRSDSTVVRKIDELGRFVIPIADRKALRFEQGDKVFLYVDDGAIFVKAAVKACYLCNSEKNLMQAGNFNFCADCMEKISIKSKELNGAEQAEQTE